MSARFAEVPPRAPRPPARDARSAWPPPFADAPALPARLLATDRVLVALAWRVAHGAARATTAVLLGRGDADLDEVAAGAALRALTRPDLPLTPAVVLDGRALERAASSAARRMARDLLRVRRGRWRPRWRRVDPLRRADTLGLSAVRPPLAIPSAEEILLAREQERAARRVLAAAEHLPWRQREAVATRLSARPLSPAARQALRAALVALRGIAAR